MHLNLWPLTSDVFLSVSVAALIADISISVFLSTSCGFCSACADIKREKKLCFLLSDCLVLSVNL